MHELSLCHSVLQILESEARRQGFSRVRRVRLEIGALAGVEPQAMAFGFEVAMRGSLAEGAQLEIIKAPGQAWCADCAQPVIIDERYDACPRCQGYQLRVTGGTELRVKDLEVD